MSRTEEGKFQDKIISWLNDIGDFVTKFSANGITKTGVPDVLICHKGLYIGLEVKKEKGIISDIQQWNINKIRESGGYAYCIKPSNWEEFKILYQKEDYEQIKELCKHNEKEIKKI